MLPLAIAIGLVSGIVAFAAQKQLRPGIEAERDRLRWEAFKRRRIDSLSLDETEDALVLARRFRASSGEIHRLEKRAFEKRKERA